ncbi:MAG: D-aminoacylase [Verrucomicrobia bacterium]|nr:D-aminoacylase [Verrucomicrobiota bacterium]
MCSSFSYSNRHNTGESVLFGPFRRSSGIGSIINLGFAVLLSIFRLLGAGNPGGADVDYDLLIRGGKIIDGSGNPWFYGDLGVRGDRIVALDRKLEGSAPIVIDARGSIVVPGFIDIHSHSDWVLLEDGAALSKLYQGVTTEVLGEGGSAGPNKGKLVPRPVAFGAGTERIATLGDYFDLYNRAEVAVNVASYVGLGNIWQCVMGHSFDPPTNDQLEAMRALLREAMKEGALGLSSQLMMPPGLLVSTDQLVELCTVVGEFGGIFSTHIRNEGLGVFDSIRQAIEIGERAAVPVDIIHLKIADREYWGRMDEVVGLIQSARDRGVDVQSNVYPYTRGNNNLSSIIPPWAHEGGRSTMLKRLSNPEARERMKKDIQMGVEGWYNHFTAVGGDWGRMLVSGNNPYRGMTMDRVLEARRNGRSEVDSLDLLFDLLIEEKGSVGTVYAHHTEDDMKLALSQPWCSVGSDGSAFAISGPLRRGNPHPRNFGTFPRVLGRYVRDQGLLSLEDAIRKMTSLNAQKAGIKNRGRLQQGWYADVTIFDLSEIRDLAGYTDPFQYCEGVSHVVVNGEVVLLEGMPTGKRPGRALRR